MDLGVSYVDFSMKKLLAVIFILFNVIKECHVAYVPPAAIVEPLHPRGLRISIPHEEGITLVAYHVKFNEDFYSLEAGTIAVDIIKKRNGRWVYEDRTTKLKLGDVIYYWVHVVYEGLGYNLLDQHHVVKEFYNYDGTPADVPKLEDNAECPQSSETEVVSKTGAERHPCSGELIFEENFDTLNTTRWTIVERFSAAPDYEFVVYKNCTQNVEAKDGSLHIKPVLLDDKYGAGFTRQGSLVLHKCTGKMESAECRRDAFGSYILPPILSGLINTKGSFNFLYGRIEVRAKLPRGDWIYPLITLENRNNGVHENELYYQIRIAAASGNSVLRSSSGADISGHVLWGGGVSITLNHSHIESSNRMTLPTKPSETLWSDDYHTYEVEWRRGRIIVRVDGDQYGAQAVSTSFDEPLYLNLALAVGGHGEFPDMSTNGTYLKPWRNIGSKALFNFYNDRNNWLPSWRDQDTGLHVDYVKIWAL